MQLHTFLLSCADAKAFSGLEIEAEYTRKIIVVFVILVGTL